MQHHFLTTPELFLREGAPMTSTAGHFDALYRDRADSVELRDQRL